MSKTLKNDAGSKKSKSQKNQNFGQDLQGTLARATPDLTMRPHCNPNLEGGELVKPHGPQRALGGPGKGKNEFFGIFDFWDPALFLEVLDIELLIPEVWDFYLFSGATLFFLL